MRGAAEADWLKVPVPRHTRFVVLAFVAVAAIGLESAAGKPAAAPKLTAAKAVDTDRNGSVDAFDLKFSGAVRGKADARAPFRFRVAGYRVTGAAAPRGRVVRVRVAEKSICDLAARPKVSYRPGAEGLQSSTKRPLRASRATAGKAARGAPRLVCSATADSDADGHLDSIVLGYSKAVRNRAQSSGKLPFQVDRYSVASISRARGLNITLRLREKEAYDTDAVPAVIYTRPKVKRALRFAVAGRGGRARSSTFNRTLDRASARMLSLQTADSNQNGLLDGVRAQFSEAVRPGRGAADVSGANITDVSSTGKTLALALAEGGLSGGDTPPVTLGAGDSIRDAAGNPVARVSRTATDAAAPVILSAVTGDRGASAGRIDALELSFSEPVEHPADSDRSYPFSVPGYGVASVGSASGTSLTLSLIEGGAADSGARPAVGYARGAGAAVTDRAGNEAANRSFGGTRDAVAPVLLGAALLDANPLDGSVDAVRYDFSEPVAHGPASCPSCSFSAAGYTLGYAGPAAGASVTVAVTGGPGPGTTTATYSPMGGGVRDGGGNLAPGATVPAADATSPVVDSAATVDDDSDGQIDRIDLAFSEPLAAAPADTVAPFSFAAAGYTISRVTAPAGDRLSVELQEHATPDTGAVPQVSYSGNGTRITDANGVELAAR
ncbi:MAG TPA: hypothetical protein VNS49_12190, partial [Streptomyces sp.]|nr:hypothetical protein [Streptomyces sp.]